MDFVTGLRCRECARPYPAEALHVCDYCFGPLEVAYDYEALRSSVTREQIAAGPQTIWRYAPLLPVSDPEPIDLGTGWTPLVRADRLAAELGLGELWVKNDTANPTGSFKDRVVSVALTKARQLGFKVAACASTGNLANSVAAHAARAGMVSVVFIPRDLEVAKVVTTAVYGGHVVAVEGTYDDVNRLCAELTSELPSWAFVNVNVRTYYAEGSKTLAFEVAEQLGLGGSGPRDRARGLGQPAHQGGQGIRRAPRRGPARRGAPRPGVGGPGRWVLAGGDGVRRGHRRHPAREAAHHRQVPRHRQPRRRVVRARDGAQERRGVRGGHRRRDPRRHPPPGPDRGDLRRDGGWRHHRHPGQAGRRTAWCGATSGWWPT